MRVRDDGTVQKSPLSLRIVEWALHEYAHGYKESNGLNDGAPSLRYMGGRLEPWCGHFVATGFRECGAPIPGDIVPRTTQHNPLASVAFMLRVFREAGWLVMSPEPGDVMILPNRDGSDAGPGMHCGIAVQRIGNRIVTVEGNYNNQVSRVDRAISLGMQFGRRPEVERQHK